LSDGSLTRHHRITTTYHGFPVEKPSYQLDMSVWLSRKHLVLSSTMDVYPRELPFCTPSLLFRRTPSQRNYHVSRISRFSEIQPSEELEWYLTVVFRLPLILNKFLVFGHANVQSRCIGSFRPTECTAHLHAHFNFTEFELKTAELSLRHSFTTIISGQDIALHYEGQGYLRH